MPLSAIEARALGFERSRRLGATVVRHGRLRVRGPAGNDDGVNLDLNSDWLIIYKWIYRDGNVDVDVHIVIHRTHVDAC